MHLRLDKNTSGRDFILGDLHGCYDLFIDALQSVGFAPETDRLISVGDIIDRGPDSAKCLELLDLPWFYMVRGNHEQMMIDAVLHGKGKPWLTEFGDWTSALTSAELQDWAERLGALPLAITLAGEDFLAGICHAEPPGLHWKDIHEPGADVQMMWGRKCLHDRPKTMVDGINITIHGHTPLECPAWVGNRYFMDTGAWHTGMLTLRKVQEIWDEHNAASGLFPNLAKLL